MIVARPSTSDFRSMDFCAFMLPLSVTVTVRLSRRATKVLRVLDGAGVEVLLAASVIISTAMITMTKPAAINHLLCHKAGLEIVFGGLFALFSFICLIPGYCFGLRPHSVWFDLQYADVAVES